ncbi:MAG: replication initiation factor domain-containing protein [Erysipelotrichaceae bacterium]|nr:replication initiation factor domain-containing protein [Erysipelotrichaceae bacterium]
MANEKFGSGVLGNTPPTNTFSKKNKLSNPFEISEKVFVCIDYLKFMIPYTDENLYRVLDMLKVEYDSYLLTEGHYDGMFRYLRRYGDLIVKLPGEKADIDDVFDNTCFCIEMTGQACRSYEDRGGYWDTLIFYLDSLNGECVRIDTPFDIHDKDILEFEEFYKMISKGWFQKTFRSIRINGDPEFITTLDFSKDFTLYLGKRGSDRFMRVYNKMAERIANGYEVFDEYWIRYEYSMAHDKSKIFVKNLVKQGFNNFGKLVSEAILDFLDFRVPTIDGIPTKDNNKARWDRWDKWINILNVTSKLKLTNENNVETNITRQKIWFDRSMAGLILGFYLTADSEQEFLNLMYNFMYKHITNKKLDPVKFERVQCDRVKHGKCRIDRTEFLNKLDGITKMLGPHKTFENDVLMYYMGILFRNGFTVRDILTEEEYQANEESFLKEMEDIFGDILVVEE